MRIWFVFLALATISIQAMAQRPDFGNNRNVKDSLNRARDSVSSKPFIPKAGTSKVYHPDSLHIPHKAFIHSAMIPGWGQVYNHKWWKVPLIYGGLGTLGYFMVVNQKDHNELLAEARARFNNVKSTGPYATFSGSAQTFYDAASNSTRNVQLTVLGVAVLWGVNCIDAYIDAKFIHSYTVDNDLTFKVTPTLINQQQPVYALNNNAIIPGVKITFGF